MSEGPTIETGTYPQAGRKEWVALAVLALPLLLVSMDVSVLYFAVPFLSADLGATATQQLWIFDVYGFVLAGLLITMGSLGDRIGRRRLLVLGALAFGAASVAAAYAQSPEMLIGARALLGVGGATLMPSTLALVRNMFHDPAQRSKAIAVWSAVMLGGISVGPVLSGLLLEHFWWGSVFLINTPFMALLLVLGPLLLPEFTAPGAPRFDLGSSGLSLLAVLPVIYGIKHIAAERVDRVAVLSITLGLVAGAVFVVRQRRVAHPMIDLALFANPRFSGSIGANTVATFAIVGNAVFLTQYLQLVVGMSPLRAALWSLVPSVVVGGAAPAAQQLAQRFFPAKVIGGSFLVAACGFGVLTQVHADSPLAVGLVGAGILSVGLVAVMTIVTELVVGAVAPDRAGAASAIMETGSELGGALGIAVLGSIGAAAFRSTLSAGLPNAAREQAGAALHDGLPGAIAVAHQLPSTVAGPFLAAARNAFTSGMNVVAVVGAAILLVAAVGIPILLRGDRGGQDAVQRRRESVGV